jgi:hypothetical protein
VVLVLAFQNCGRASFSSTQPHTETQQSIDLLGGGGIDGKPYVTRGSCDGKVGIVSTIKFNGDASQALLVRSDCQELPSARVLNRTEVAVDPFDPAVLLYKNKIFDRQAPEKRVTARYCRDLKSHFNVRVWGDPDENAALLGQVYGDDGSSSGALQIAPLLLSAPGEFRTASFTLTLSGDHSGYLDYKGSKIGVTCADPQSLAALGAYDDGAALAASDVAPYPALLGGYVVRPPWKSAGIDYAVGAPSGMSLKDPAAILISGVSVDTANHLVEVSGNDITLDGYDFSLNGGWSVHVSGSNVRLLNSVFIETSSQADSAIVGEVGSKNLYVANSTIDGGGGVVDPVHRGLITMLGDGLTVERCWLKNAARSVVDGSWGAGLSGSVTVRYNLIENSGRLGVAGAYMLGLGPKGATNVRFVYNVSRETAGGQSAGLAFFNNGPVDSLEIGNNVMLALGSSSLGYWVHLDSSVSSGKTHDNFLDLSGALGFAYSGSSSAVSLFMNNVNLNSGGLWPANP